MMMMMIIIIIIIIIIMVNISHLLKILPLLGQMCYVSFVLIYGVPP